jgi:outer membrane protein assembly factor BamB
MKAVAPSRDLLQLSRLPRLLLAAWMGFGLLPRGLGADWPQYRGSNHDGISTDRIKSDWTGAITNPVWQLPVPNCLGSFAVSGGRALTQTLRANSGGSQEYCVALNAADGTELWAAPVDVASYPEGGVGFDDGPRTTPAIEGGSAYVLSSYLKLYRLNVTNGTVLWRKDLLMSYGGSVIAWENAASPVIEDGLIFVNANCGTNTLMALRTSDGSPAWRSQNEAMTHSTPVLATIHGVRQVIFATQSGLVSLVPSSGELLWKFSYPFVYGTCIGASPVIYQDMVFVAAAQVYDMGSAVARIDHTETGWVTTQLWANISFTSTLSSHWMTPVCLNGFLYGQFGSQQFDSVNAQLKCVEMQTGVQRWSVDGFGRSSPVLVDGRIVSLTERGQLVQVAANPDVYTELARFTAIPNWDGNSNKCWNVPAVADGRFYVRSTSYAACFDLGIPPLKMDPPQNTGPGQFRLTVRAADGSALAPERVAGLEVRASTDLSQDLADWMKLPNLLELSDGVVRVDLDPVDSPQRYFIVREPK